MFSIFTHIMKPVRDTNSEPGLPLAEASKFMIGPFRSYIGPRQASKRQSLQNCTQQ